MIPLRQQHRLRLAAAVLQHGGIVAYPTEAVWGLGCDPHNHHAVQRLLELKRRRPEKGLILIAAEIEMFRPLLAGLSPSQRATLESRWPGPTTWLIPDNGSVSHWVSGGGGRVAIRVSAHPVAAALSRAFGGPLISSSANPQGLPPARNLTRVKTYFGRALDAYVPGQLGGAVQPSEIRDLLSGEIIRAAG